MRDYPYSNFKPNSFERHALDNGQDKQHEAANEAYTLATIGEGEIKLATIASVTYLYTRKDGVVYRTSLTAV